MTYTNVGVHVSEAGNLSGWTKVNASGTINLMKMVNVSTTIASVNITSGDYNALRFNISAAKVAYNGNNYTAFVPYAELIVPIPGGIEVNNSKPAATILDMTPTVYNIGSNSNPEFIIRAVARAFTVPANQETGEIHHLGYRLSLIGKTWWRNIIDRSTANLQLSNVTLSSNALSFAVKNTGNDSEQLYMVTVTPVAATDCVSRDASGHFRMGDQHQMDAVHLCLTNSSVFILNATGTLQPLRITNFKPGEAASQLSGPSGYTLANGTSASLSYSGQIVFLFRFLGGNTPGVTAGNQYLVTVIGHEALAGFIVVAS